MKKNELPRGLKDLAVQFVQFIEEVDKSKNSSINKQTVSSDKINKMIN